MAKRTPPRSIEQIMADKRASGKNLGGRPPGRKNNSTLEREAEERKLSTGQGTTPPVQPDQPPAQPQAAPVTDTLDETIKKLKMESVDVSGPPVVEKKADEPSGGPPPPPAPMQPTARKFITGRLLLVVLDGFFANGIVFLLNKFAGHDLTKRDLMLTPDEAKELGPVADEVAAMIQANPIVVLALSMGAMYMGKIPSKKKEPLL